VIRRLVTTGSMLTEDVCNGIHIGKKQTISGQYVGIEFDILMDRVTGILVPLYSAHTDLGHVVLHEWTIRLDISELAQGSYVIRFGSLQAAFTVDELALAIHDLWRVGGP
jgi:hypothetical protein